MTKWRFSQSQAQMPIQSAKNRSVHRYCYEVYKKYHVATVMITSRYNEKHSNFIIAITKSILITQISILYHLKLISSA